MKINYKYEMDGKEVIEAFFNQINEKKLAQEGGKFKIIVTNKEDKEVVVPEEKLKLVYSNE